jgi:dolichyl-phosphate-mannose--protein O-mannosyl transferase
MKQAKRFIPLSLITVFALILRLWNLNKPSGYIFDEIYYAKNANSLIQNGVEINAAGEGEFVVHPPLGKWLIGIGIKVFGNNEFGWRISAALIGTVCVVLLFLITQRLFNSFYLSHIAALLMALDGLNLVMSRIALLDIFLLFFTLLIFYFYLTGNFWLVGLFLGAAISVKWSGAYLIPVLLILSMNLLRSRLFKEYLIRTVQLTLLPLAVYLISWSGWFTSNLGWGRNWAQSQGDSVVPDGIRSFWNYHLEILNFHSGLTESHSYAANPWNWLILGRPTSFFYESPKNCGESNCSQEILAIGTPVLWWAGAIAIAVLIGFWIAKRDSISNFIVLGLATTYLPWFLIQSRTMFYFYAVVIAPFLILAIIYSFNKFLLAGYARKWINLFVVVVFANFVYFLPVLMGIEITYSQWLSRMWLPSWI